MNRTSIMSIVLCGCVGTALWSFTFRPSDADTSDGSSPTAPAHETGMSADEQLVTETTPLPSREEISSSVTLPSIPFTNVTAESGLEFQHERGLSDERLLPETMGSGCAVINLNDDEFPDLVFVNSKAWEWAEQGESKPATLAAWLNLGDMNFRNVTEEMGLDISLYGMGAAVGDFDNDHDDDLYITAVGNNVLLRNDGDRFTDVTAETGTAGGPEHWGASAGWFDFDNDGDLDLFVSNYIQWTRQLEQVVDAITFAGDPRFGSPDAYPGDAPMLFRNDDGVFTDIAAAAGLNIATKSLGIAFLDVNHDRHVDVFVANDGVADQLWLNSGKSTFEDIAVTSGVAFSSTGAARAGMGIDIADFRNDGSCGIAIGQYENEMTGLFAGLGDQAFRDVALETGIGRDSLPDLTWGVRWADFDLDGRLDLLTANGHVEQSDSHMFRAGRYLQEPRIYWNAGQDSPREFVPLSAAELGNDFFEATSGRALAVADFDGDGDLDIVTASSGRVASVFRNDLPTSPRHWLQVKLTGKLSGSHSATTSAIGSTIELTSDGVTQRRFIAAARGYLSSSPLTATFGIPSPDEQSQPTIESARIYWPAGTTQDFEVRELNRRYDIHQSKNAAHTSSSSQDQ